MLVVNGFLGAADIDRVEVRFGGAFVEPAGLAGRYTHTGGAGIAGDGLVDNALDLLDGRIHLRLHGGELRLGIGRLLRGRGRRTVEAQQKEEPKPNSNRPGAQPRRPEP